MSTLLEESPSTSRGTTAPRVPKRSTPRRRRRALLLLGGPLVLALLVALIAQVVLPDLATNRLRDRLQSLGTVSSVQVSSAPAVKLLWGDADEIDVRLATFRAGTPDSAPAGGSGSLGDALDATRAIERLDVRIDELRLGPVKLTDVRVRKRGADAHVQATVATAELDRGLPSAPPIAALASLVAFEGTPPTIRDVHVDRGPAGLTLHVEVRVA